MALASASARLPRATRASSSYSRARASRCGRRSATSRAVASSRLRRAGGQAAEQNHTGDRIGGLAEAGAGEVVVDKTLRDESREQPANHGMLQVELDHLICDGSGVFENDWADGGTPAPFQV